MTTKIVFILAVLVLIVALILARVVRPRPQAFEADILARSHRYIETLGKKPFEVLNTEQKLLLLHSYYNVGNYASAVRTGERVFSELQTLSPERQQPFLKMIEESRRKLGIRR